MELLAYLLTGAAAGLLAGLLGVGGGIIIVPMLAWLFAQHGFASESVMHYAVGTSLAVIIPTSLSSMLTHQRLGGVLWPVVRRMMVGVIPGALLGAWLAAQMNSAHLSRFFGVFMLLIALKFIVGIKPGSNRTLPGSVVLGCSGAAIGLVSSVLGIGGGSMSVPLLLWCGQNIRVAVGTSAALGLPIAVAGTAGFIVNGLTSTGQPGINSGFVYWPAVAGVVLASVALAPLGARLTHHLPQQTLQHVFALLLVIIGLKMIAGG
jgi:uncharacterized membrane protein YfcA